MSREKLSYDEKEILYRACRIVDRLDSPIKSFWRGETHINVNSSDHYCLISFYERRDGSGKVFWLILSYTVWDTINKKWNYNEYKIKMLTDECLELTFCNRGEEVLESI